MKDQIRIDPSTGSIIGDGSLPPGHPETTGIIFPGRTCHLLPGHSVLQEPVIVEINISRSRRLAGGMQARKIYV